MLYKVLQNGQDGSWKHAASSKASYEFLNYLSAHYIIFPLIVGLCSMLISHDLVVKGPNAHYAYVAISLFNRVNIFIKRTAFISTVEATANWLSLQKGIYRVWGDLQGNQGSKITACCSLQKRILQTAAGMPQKSEVLRSNRS